MVKRYNHLVKLFFFFCKGVRIIRFFCALTVNSTGSPPARKCPQADKGLSAVTLRDKVICVLP